MNFEILTGMLLTGSLIGMFIGSRIDIKPSRWLFITLVQLIFGVVCMSGIFMISLYQESIVLPESVENFPAFLKYAVLFQCVCAFTALLASLAVEYFPLRRKDRKSLNIMS